jgi:hypothetical protein
MKRVYCMHHQLFGECKYEDWDNARYGINPARTVQVVFKVDWNPGKAVFQEFRQAIPICYMREQDFYVCEKYNTAWMGKMNEMHENYEYPTASTWTHLSETEAQRILSDILEKQHA